MMKTKGLTKVHLIIFILIGMALEKKFLKRCRDICLRISLRQTTILNRMTAGFARFFKDLN